MTIGRLTHFGILGLLCAWVGRADAVGCQILARAFEREREGDRTSREFMQTMDKWTRANGIRLPDAKTFNIISPRAHAFRSPIFMGTPTADCEHKCFRENVCGERNKN